MAKVFLCLIFLLVIVPNEVFCIRGGKALKCANLITCGAKVTRGASPTKLQRPAFRFDEVYVNSFRPTTPGHSPSIGHSKHD